MTWPPPVSTVAVAALAASAVAFDLRSRRVPNVLTFGAAAVAVVIQGLNGGWPGVAAAVLGWLAGAALFFPLFALGGMGAGDVKLLAAFGAWLGPAGALWTGLIGALAGGVMAVAFALARGYLRTALRNVGGMLRAWRIAGIRPVEGLTIESPASVRLPYAVPLAVGALATLLSR
jgi:prepilin peptidase CpaA